ncbi:hypothetical protein JCM11957_09760 [Caminibacter profundus]
MDELMRDFFYKDGGLSYSIIDKKVYKFLNPVRGDVFVEVLLFEKFKEEILDVYNLKFEEIYFAIETENNLYIVLLTPTFIEYYISKGDGFEAKKVVSRFIGYLIGYIKGFEIGLKKGFFNAKI